MSEEELFSRLVGRLNRSRILRMAGDRTARIESDGVRQEVVGTSHFKVQRSHHSIGEVAEMVGHDDGGAGFQGRPSTWTSFGAGRP